MKKVIPGKIKTQLRLDGYYNVLNKYGTQHDSTEYYQWASGSAVSDKEQFYRTMYRMKKITAVGVWEKVDEGELTKAQALRICGPRPKES